MVQAYQGYFQDGRFVSPELLSVPENVKVYVMVTGEQIISKDSQIPFVKTRAQQQLEAFDNFVLSVRAIDNEPLTDKDFAELENNRVNFTRELDL